MMRPSILILIGELDVKKRSEAFFSTMSLNNGRVFSTKLRFAPAPDVESLSAGSSEVLPSSRSVFFICGPYSSSSSIFRAPVSSMCALSARLLSSLMRSRISFFESAFLSASS